MPKTKTKNSARLIDNRDFNVSCHASVKIALTSIEYSPFTARSTLPPMEFIIIFSGKTNPFSYCNTTFALYYTGNANRLLIALFSDQFNKQLSKQVGR